MAIAVARLAPGRVERNPTQSVNTTMLGQIYTDEDRAIKAVIKSLSPRQLANELIAAELVSALNLPGPRGFLVFADPEDSFDPNACRHPNGYQMFFGSELSPFPTFYTFFNMQDSMALGAILQCNEWGSVVGFDEWIANTDRHLNNFLYDGQTIYLFDHDRCLSGANWSPPDLEPSIAYPCHVVVDYIHQQLVDSKKRQAARLAGEIERRASELDLDDILNKSYAREVNHGIPVDLPAAVEFLRLRIPHIARLCAGRLSVGGLL